jgi:ribokinase
MVSAARPVVIDTDPGVDDALALMLALRSPELRLELITTVAGNVTVERATANARHVLALFNPPLWPVIAQGAARPLRRSLYTSTFVHGADGLGGLTQLQRPDGRLRYPLPPCPSARRQAVRRLLRVVETYGRELTIVALGPMTNIARAIQRAPELMRRIGRLVIMGGAIAVPGNVTPTAEFNIFVDPHAADVVLTSGLPITLIPLDVTRQVRLTSTFFRQTVRGAGTALAQAVRHMTRHLLTGPQAEGMAMHDPLAVAVALDPSLVRTTRLPVVVETQGQQTLGMTVADRRPASRQSTVLPHADVALQVDAERVLRLVAERVLSRQLSRTTVPQRQARIVVVGSANTDLTVQTARLPTPGETVLAGTLYTSFGGKGANQAVAAKRAGARTTLLARLGRDRYGQDYADHLRQEGLDTAYLQWASDVPSGIALITVDRRGQNQIVVAPGANSALQARDLQAIEAVAVSAQALLVQLETPLATVEAALRWAKAAGITTLLNPAPARHLPARFARLVDLLIPNENEAAMLCGKPVASLRQARIAANLLYKQGYGVVVLTLGRRGVMYRDAQGAVHLPAHQVAVQDATAAGDTFVGYLACVLAEGRALAEAVMLANAAAALAVTRPGAQASIPQRHEVQSFLAAQMPSGPSGL